jgi:hypothetical protein
MEERHPKKKNKVARELSQQKFSGNKLVVEN